MSRKSRADLAVVPMVDGGRPRPPADLDALEQRVWIAIVNASPPFSIDVAAQVILRRVCAQAAICEEREARLREWRQARYAENDNLIKLANEHAAAAKTVAQLLTSLRATPRSKTRPRDMAAKGARVPVDRPWEDGLAS